MDRFIPDRYYRTSDPELRLVATRGTLGIWRHENRGPRYTRLGGHVLYRGADLNEYLDSLVVETSDSRRTGERADALCA